MYVNTIDYMTNLVESKMMPGISFAFMSKEAVFSDTLGVKQLEPHTEELRKDTLYDMASLTKVICTTTVLLKLIEEKTIEIDKPLHEYLPEFLDKQVTIRELLTHTADINAYIPNRDELGPVALKNAILKLKSGEKRGKQVVYTDTGTVLLGFLIEKIYDKPVQEVFQEEVLLPLDMNKSGFDNFDLQDVAPTEITEKRGLIKGEVHDPKAFVLGKHCGSAGLFSTVEDTTHFVKMMFQKGFYNKKPFLQEKTVLKLLKSYTCSSSKARSLGWDLIPFNNEFILYHTGYTGTFFIIDILSQEAFIFLSNRVHPRDNRNEYLKVRDELIKIYLSERQSLQ